MVKEANKITPVTARLIWTRYRGHTKLAQDLTGQVNEAGLTALSTSLTMRVAYTDALGRGLTGAEMQDRSAKAEVKALINEIENLLRKTS